ncbi:MAG: glycosyltransferase [Candidatus Binatia bacterium]
MRYQAQDTEKRHILTIAMEDYFHVGAFNQLIQHGQWYRFPTRFEQNTRKALDLLDRFNIKATFFVLGWIADKQPDIVREVVLRGHEVASRGYYHRSIQQMTRDEFREDLARSRDALERAAGTQMLGFRVAHNWFAPNDLWALEVLAQEGYAYDSSVLPTGKVFWSDPQWRFMHARQYGNTQMWEVPLSTWTVAGWNVPIAGGNYFRQFPHRFVKSAVERWHQTSPAPFVMYFHVWELDPEQPKIGAASPLARIRHYRNLEKMAWVLADYFTRYQFSGVARYLNLTPSPIAGDSPALLAPAAPQLNFSMAVQTEASSNAGGSERETVVRTPVSVVVPCFNEELVLPYLANTLRSVETTLGTEYDLHFIFVDDGSSDDTWNSLQQLFGGRADCTVVRHPQNRGVAAAILTGLRLAQTELVTSIDCDCTYDPHELKNMLPLLTEETDLVTASPYHPQGKVLNVPSWRLSLSKAASFLYRCVLPQKLYTYTSCFRVYRKSTIASLELHEQGFLGITEIVGQLGLCGARLVEYPAVLEVRVLGHSKMKVCRTILGHLRLLSRLLLQRTRQRCGFPLVQPLSPESAVVAHSQAIVAPRSVSTAKEKCHE